MCHAGNFIFSHGVDTLRLRRARIAEILKLTLCNRDGGRIRPQPNSLISSMLIFNARLTLVMRTDFRTSNSLIVANSGYGIQMAMIIAAILLVAGGLVVFAVANRSFGERSRTGFTEYRLFTGDCACDADRHLIKQALGCTGAKICLQRKSCCRVHLYRSS